MAEFDPTGKDPHSAGAKLDAGKLMAGLVLGDFARALTEVSRVGTFGARKYTPHGWIEVDDGVARYTDAMVRHYLKENSGESYDPDSGLLHAAHLAWNALARLDLMIRATEQSGSPVMPEFGEYTLVRPESALQQETPRAWS